MTEKEILSKIQSYNYYIAVKTELEGQLESLVSKITTEYGEMAGGGSGTFDSKVEKLAINRTRLESKIKTLDCEICEIKRLIEKSGLDEMEQDILWQVAKSERLISYSRRNNVSKSYVYKIRDRALKKIASKTQNVG